MTATGNEQHSDLRDALGAFPPSLLQEFDGVRARVADVLTPEQLRDWGEEGLGLARGSLRSWEAAAAYFRASPALLDRLTYHRFRAWVAVGVDMAEASPALAGAYFRASPDALPHVSVAQAADWALQGQSLYKGTWKSGSLAALYFDVSPQVLPHLPLSQVRLLVDLVEALATHSYELAGACLSMAPAVLAGLDRPDRTPFLEFGSVVAHTAWVDARVYFERGPTLVRHVHPQQRARFLALAGRVAMDVGRFGHPYFMEVAQALAEVDRETHRELLELSEELIPHSGIAAMEFMKAAPTVLQRLRSEDLRLWQERGQTILRGSVPGGEAFFRLESSKGEEILDALSSRVELGRVSELLRMYCKALTATDVAVLPSDLLTEKGVGWVDESSPSTEGSAIFLPRVVERYASKDENFAVYKVFATHQAARLEFGSFQFRFNRPGHLLGDTQRTQRRGSGDTTAHTDMERFFDLLPDRRLAHDLFTIVEDTRIDALVKREYAGIRRALERLQVGAMEQRRPLEDMPAREAAVENLLRASLDEAGIIKWPRDLGAVMEPSLRILAQIRRPGASVEDSAEATLLLYDWLSRLPNVELEDASWEEMDNPSGGAAADGDDEMLLLGDQGGAGADAERPFQLGGDEPYESPDPVEFRGDFKPELVQLLMKLKSQPAEGQQGHAQMAPLTKEQIQELLEKSVEISIDELMAGDLTETTGMFLENLMKEVTASQQQGPGLPDGRDPPEEGEEEDQSPLVEEPASFYYDEWDFRANDYKPRWCRVQERRLESGEDDFYDDTLREHAGLVRETRRQFELLRPEMFRKIKRLPDGEDYDLDAVVEWHIQRRAGAPTDDKLFFRRNKVERDVAVAFLLDMSASTDEEIQKPEKRSYDDDFDDDPRKYLTWWAQRRADRARNPAKRIIDLEKESTVLLIEALETIGDKYGVYGFSGYGRDNVEFYIIKDMDETFSTATKRYLDKVAPVRSTRMGPAIRHCIAKLNATDAKVKILVLLSDGRPQDHGYGRDRTEKEYAIHDTRMALLEARREGMTPFCLTVDRAGHDYLQQMCEDMGYEVVSDIESLPRRLPSLYRRLTQ